MFPNSDIKKIYEEGYKARLKNKSDMSHNYIGVLKAWWLAGYRDYELENEL